MMKILIANPGSTSYKCKFLDMSTGEALFRASVERIGDEEGIVTLKWGEEPETSSRMHIPDYEFAVNQSVEALKEKVSLEEISAVGFKVVLAKDVTGCVELTPDVIHAIEEYLPLAPVHNSLYLSVISIFQKLLSGVSLVALLETSFHREIPPEAFLYGIPFDYYERLGVRKYGFHGASHRYISEYAREKYGQEKNGLKIISCHLGGSSSICAIRDGVSIDTSMGMSPQSGLINAKRVGDLDPYALLYIMEREGLSIEEMREVLGSSAGVYGISGLSGDFRDIEAAMDQGDERARYAFQAFAYSAKRYVGEYMAVLNRADILVFTGGLGQNSPAIRKAIAAEMENLGIVLDDTMNGNTIGEGVISRSDSPVRVVVAPTNEEAVVARAVRDFLEGRGV